MIKISMLTFLISIIILKYNKKISRVFFSQSKRALFTYTEKTGGIIISKLKKGLKNLMPLLHSLMLKVTQEKERKPQRGVFVLRTYVKVPEYKETDLYNLGYIYHHERY